jgi:hypothetical protein
MVADGPGERTCNSFFGALNLAIVADVCGMT